MSQPEAVAVRTPVGRYYAIDDGGWYPSVTTILDQTMNSGKAYGLRKWWRADPAKAEAEVEIARAKGQLVHDYVEAAINGTPLDLNALDEDVRKAASSLINLVEVELTEVWRQEHPVWSNIYGYAGRLDLVGVWRGRPCVIDFKTSKKRQYRSGMKDALHQVAAYAIAFNERNPDMPRIEHGAVFNTVHGIGVQAPLSVVVAEERAEFIKRIGLYRQIGKAGMLHEKRNW